MQIYALNALITYILIFLYNLYSLNINPTSVLEAATLCTSSPLSLSLVLGVSKYSREHSFFNRRANSCYPRPPTIWFFLVTVRLHTPK